MNADRLHVIDDGDVDTAAVVAWEATRRDMIRRGLVAGGVSVVAATSIPLLLRIATATAAAKGDADVLAAVARLEQVAVFAYDAAARSGVLDTATTKLAERFRDQEQAHADAIIAALQELGGTAPAKPAGVADVDAVVAGLGQAGTQPQILMFAIELETAAVAAYHDAHLKLEAAKLLQTAATIMASEGQHLVVLRKAVGRDPVPGAFETGRA